ncbi:hypothetical protein LOAG_02877 [Loa loa]|uniref:Uncharacterized protein n=1 Tax=Loa loa TaxID=7209 RepID=A0A1S0U5Q4_LOALO|nr:hypothetical protein LOAG_02877 [Loa loa]EFO25607.1 hypothetical protein LOAG_02877 [Loa loa]
MSYNILKCNCHHHHHHPPPANVAIDTAGDEYSKAVHISRHQQPQHSRIKIAIARSAVSDEQLIHTPATFAVFISRPSFAEEGREFGAVAMLESNRVKLSVDLTKKTQAIVGS